MSRNQTTEHDEPRQNDREAIAIVGMACRFPGAKSLRAFWLLLREGVDAISEVPSDRWDIDEFYDPDPSTPGKTNSRWGGFLDRVDQFDPEFFGIASREAVSMDPQQRLLLELGWEALEDAGLVARDLAGSATGVFVGISTNDYGQIEPRDPRLITAYWSTGNALNIAASRLSYFFDFRGPSIAIDSACSASLVAVHYACSSLWQGECSLALAAGVNLILSPTPMIHFAKAGALAADGRCKAFDARADGIVRGEGAGVVVLKLLSQAIAASDPIYALVRGSAVNQDGQSNGITAPRRQAQENVLRSAYRAAGISPGRVQYVEAHGTGTLLGDPVEMKALGNVLAHGRSADTPCRVGSVKTNIGHLESAAGIASLIKVALALKHREIPPSLHFKEPNPHIPFDKLLLRVQHALGPWSDDEPTAIAGVSSFGFGGTNVHVVMEEAPSPSEDGESRRTEPEGPYLLPLSAHSSEALQELVRSWIDFLEGDRGTDEPSLRDLVYTASVRRSHHAQRTSLVFGDRRELMDRLENILRGRAGPVAGPSRPRVVFVFSGQGAGWWAVGEGLLRREARFRETVEQCDRALRECARWSLLERLTEDAGADFEDMEFMQPAVFSVQVALSSLWDSWGICPDAVVGHSMGEIAAAHVAGVLSLEDAIRVVYHRGRLMQQALRASSARGGMAVVRFSMDDARQLVTEVEGHLSIAAQNGPKLVILSGENEALDSALRSLKKKRIPARRLPVPGAGHGTHLEQVGMELIECLRDVRPVPASLPLYSTVTGGRTTGESFTAEYWSRNLTEPVLFSGALEALSKGGHDVFVEVSRHPVLLGAISECLGHGGRDCVVLPSLRRNHEERRVLLYSLGALYTLGRPVRWSALYPGGGRCVSLPSYPWLRRRFWFTENLRWRFEGSNASTTGNGPGDHPLLGRYLRPAVAPQMHFWQTELDATESPWLGDHRLEGLALVPSALFIEMFLAAAEEIYPGRHVLEELNFVRSLFLPRQGVRSLQLVWTRESQEVVKAQIYSLPKNAPTSEVPATLHAEAKLRTNGKVVGQEVHERTQPEVTQGRCREALVAQDLYEVLAEGGLQIAARFRALEEAWFGGREMLGRVRAPHGESLAAYASGLHPTIVESGFDLFSGVHALRGNEILLPSRIESVEVQELSAEDHEIWVNAVGLPTSAEGKKRANLFFVDASGKALLRMLGVEFEHLPRYMQRTNLEDWVYQVTWLKEESQKSPPIAQGRWVLFCDTGGVGDQLSLFLKSRGHVVDRVYWGKSEESWPPGSYHVDPDNLADFQELFGQSVRGTDEPPLRGVVHLWSLDSPRPDETASEGLDLAQRLGCKSVLHVVQSLLRTSGERLPRVWLVTKGAQPVYSADKSLLSVAQAPLWGFGRALAQEQQELGGGLIDLDPAASVERDAECLLTEVSRDDREDQIAFRGGQRYLARLTRMDPGGGGSQIARSFRADGVYVVTGGLGELGLLVARFLAERGARRILLLSRTGLPPRAEWDQIAMGTRQARRVETIRAIENLGVSIETAAVDVTDESRMRTVLSSLRTNGSGPVRGVFHLAGVAHGASLAEMDVATLSTELRPKVLGSWVLHSLLADDPLDFFVLFSSGAAVLGSPLLAGYAAGNAFLDALAHYRRALGKAALSINWGLWAEAGMAARQLRKMDRELNPRGMLGFTNRQGLEMLERLLQQDVSQAIVVHYDWKEWSRFHRDAAAAPLLSELFRKPDTGASRKTRLADVERIREALFAAKGDDRRRRLEAYLVERTAEALGMTTSKPNPHQSLMHLGIDSLIALELKNRIELELRVIVPVAQLLDGPTIAQLAGLLVERVEDTASKDPRGTRRATRGGARLPSRDSDELLDRVDELSDDEVDDLLRSMGVDD